LPQDTPARHIKTAVDVIALLSETINHVRTGAVDPKVGNCIGYLAGIVLKATQQGELEERLAALEGIVSGQNPARSILDDDPEDLLDDGNDNEGDERAIA